MQFDEILIKIGEFGKYQKIRYFMLCVPSTFLAFVVLAGVFLSAVPNFRCAIPDLENDTYSIQNPEHALRLNHTVPWVKDDNKWILSEDEIYLIDASTKFSNVTGIPENATKVECDAWVYDRSVFESTTMTEFNKVGKKNGGNRVLLSTMVMGGLFVGATVFGVLSDVYGRRIAFFLCVACLCAFGVASAWAPEFYSFVFFRFMSGAACSGLFLCSFVLGMELVGPSKRVIAGMVIEYFFALGACILPGIAYLIRNWRYLQTALVLPNILLFSYWWFLPESPRWLITKGRMDEAEKILRKMAAVNRVILPDKLFSTDDYVEVKPQFSFKEYIRSKTLVIRTLVIYFNWMVVSMVYYGLSLNAGNLGGNIFLNSFLSGLVEFPAYTFCILTMNPWGRKPPHITAMMIGGVTLVCTVFVVLYAGDLNWLMVTFAMIGKFGAAAGFAIIYVFSAELYPTVMRNFGMGTSSTCARVGSILAPIIANVGTMVGGNFEKLFPLVTFGVFSILAAVATIKLPETRGRSLPETIEDGKQFGRVVHFENGDPTEYAFDNKAMQLETQYPYLKNNSCCSMNDFGNESSKISNDSDAKNLESWHELLLSRKGNGLDNHSTLVSDSCVYLIHDIGPLYVTSLTEFGVFVKSKKYTSFKTLVMSGLLVGSLIFGLAADTYGRKTMQLVAFILVIIGGFGTAWAQEYYSFVFLQFVCSVASTGMYVSCLVLAIELVGPSKRVLAVICIQYFYSLGSVILPGIAYLVRKWRYLQTVLSSLTCILVMPCCWLVAESPRWLLSKDRIKEAETVIRKIAEVNHVSIPEHLFKNEDFKENVQSNAATYFFKSKLLVIRTLILSANWVAAYMVFYGISHGPGRIGGNIYLNSFLSGLVEFPAYTISLISLEKLGRKVPHVTAMILSALVLLATVFVELYFIEYYWVMIVCIMIGKLTITICFGILLVHSAELYPTVVRHLGLAICSISGKCGAILAPVLKYGIDGMSMKAFPYLLFGLLSLVAGILAITLPETIEQPLPETVDDIENRED
ncbi:organic cation transporter-like protein [Tubulanus polymorphus]|uniref:organic cation transporter-like protein n=1 Tax=Tubulanus polymorphus TaxID=672921 RepID=UPI003DA32EF3